MTQKLRSIYLTLLSKKYDPDCIEPMGRSAALEIVLPSVHNIRYADHY